MAAGDAGGTADRHQGKAPDKGYGSVAVVHEVLVGIHCDAVKVDSGQVVDTAQELADNQGAGGNTAQLDADQEVPVDTDRAVVVDTTVEAAAVLDALLTAGQAEADGQVEAGGHTVVAPGLTEAAAHTFEVVALLADYTKGAALAELGHLELVAGNTAGNTVGSIAGSIALALVSCFPPSAQLPAVPLP